MAARPREVWTRLVIDPLADPFARRLAPRSWVTPNRVTGVASVLGVAAAACLAAGRLRVGGALFLLRFFCDCLDGKVARLQGTSSARGALFDVGSDVVCVTAAYTALGWWATRNDQLDGGWVLALLAAVTGYSWALAHRKHLAASAGLGDGGADHTREVAVPLLGAWVRACRRIDMSPVPWAVEAETLTLGLLPLLLPDAAARGLLVALAFYVVATTVNLRRLWRIAGVLDHRTAAPNDTPAQVPA